MFGAISNEWDQAFEATQLITGHTPAQFNPDFSERRLHVDTLNARQIDYIQQYRMDPENEDLALALKLTISGIAAGLQHTG